MVNTTNPHYITQNATGTSLTQPVDTVDFPHSGLIKALNQMAAGNVVVKTGTDFDINQTGGDLVVAAGKILRNGKYHEVATKTFADSALTTTYAKGYHLLVVADGREGGETVNLLYLRPPTATNRVPEFKLGDTIVAMIEYSSSTSAGSRLIQYFTTNKESNSLSIAYGVGSDPNKVYTQAMTVDADADGDVTFENVVQDKDIIFKVDDGGTPTEVMRVDGSTSRVGIGATAPTAKLEVVGDVNISRSASTGQTRTLSIEGARNATGTDYARIDLENYDSNGPTSYVGARISAINEADGVNDGSLVFSTNNANAGIAERMRIDDEGNVGIGTGSAITANLHVQGTGTDDDNPILLVESTDSGTATGPELVLYRNSSSAADDDALGHLLYRGKNDAGSPQDVTYAQIYSKIGDMTDGTEDGELYLRTIINGTLQNRLEINASELVINNGHNDVDFRVEGDTEANLLFVNAGTERVGIGTNVPSSQLDIRGPAGSGAATGGALTLSTAELTVVDGDYLGIINFQAPLETGADAVLVGASIHAEADITFDATNNATELVFSTASTSAAIERMRIDQSGDVLLTENLGAGGKIETDTYFQSGVEVTAGGGAPVTLSKGIHLVSAASAPCMVNLPDATATNLGWHTKIVNTAAGGGGNITTLNFVGSSQVLVDSAYGTLISSGGAYTLGTGKAYDLMVVAVNYWMIIELN